MGVSEENGRDGAADPQERRLEAKEAVTPREEECFSQIGAVQDL